MAARSWRVVSMSRTWGMFSSVTGSSVSSAAAIAGKAAFLAPLTRIVPSSGLPPRITNLSTSVYAPRYAPSNCPRKVFIVARNAFFGAGENPLDAGFGVPFLNFCDGLSDMSTRARQRVLRLPPRRSRPQHDQRQRNALARSRQRRHRRFPVHLRRLLHNG